VSAEPAESSASLAPPSVTIVAHDVGTPGGMERQLAELCSGLLTRGHPVTVIARQCALPAHPLLRSIRVRAPRRPFSLAYPAFAVLASLAVRRWRDGVLHTTGALVLNRADVSTVHFCHHGFRAAGGTTRMSRSTASYRLNARLAEWMSLAAERFCYRRTRTRRLVTVSGGVARELEEHLSVAPASVTVIPNGVDADEFAPDPQARAETRERLGISRDDLVAIFVGGEWERKGLRVAIEGVARADGWRLLVVGAGDVRSHRQIAEQHGASARIHFVGPSTEPARYYAAADVFLLPSSYEAFPLVSLEAAASGLPLLISRVSGAEELVTDGRNGWLVDRDADEIADRLRLLNDPELRSTMAGAARDSIGRYRWSDVVSSYQDVYAALTGQSG
jgi:glycosyltransferase involved in cell wall biosynthesis